MKRRIFSLLLALCMVFAMLPVTTFAASIVERGTCGDNLTWTLDAEGTLTISGTGEMSGWVDEYDAPWYTYREIIKTLVIEDGVTSICERSFHQYRNLTSISLPDSITSVGGGVFNGCSSLTSVDLPDGITSIGGDIFGVCSSLTSVDLPDALTSIGIYSFNGCNSLTSIDLPEGIISIDCYAFSNCSSLAEITFNGNAPEIAENAFNNVTATVYYPSGNATWTDDARQNYGGTLTWVEKWVEPSGKCGDDLTWTLDAEGTLTISGEGAMYDYSSGTAPWNGYRAQILSAVVEDGVTSIGHYAFHDCSSLTSIVIPGSVTSIGNSTFRGCSSLTTIDIPAGVTSIGSDTFSGCRSLTSIDLPAGVTSIGHFAFQGCSSLASIVIPAGVTSIGGSAFSGCSSLASVVLPEGLHSIKDAAFMGCSSLTSIIIPSGVTSIGFDAFYGCKNLKTVTFMGNAPSFDPLAFEGVTVNAYYPAGNASWTTAKKQNYGGTITWKAYYETGDFSGTCGDELTWVYDPGNKTLTISGIGEMYDWNVDFAPWYDHREEIETVVVEAGVTTIGEWAFYECSRFAGITLPDSLTYISSSAFNGCSGLESIDLPGSVTGIGRNAFSSCSNLRGITFNGNAPYIADDAFYNVNANAYYPGGNATWTDAVKRNYGGNINWVPFNEDGAVAIGAGKCGESLTWVLTEDGVLTISGTGETYDWTYTNAPWYSYSEVIETVVVEEGVTSIGQNAFWRCTNLTGVDLPSSVTTLDSEVFYDCKSLTSISIPNTVTSIGNSIFAGCDNLTNVDLPDHITAIGSGTFYKCKNLKNVDIPTGVTSIGVNAFYNCSSLSSIELPAGVTALGNSAFYGCSGLASINLPAGIPSIGEYTFYNCSSLTNIALPAGVTSIGDAAFSSCTKLTTIGQPVSLTSIGKSAFNNCRSLTSIFLPEGLTFIGEEAFSGCSRLSTITFAGNAPSISGNAFNSVKAKAYYPAGNASWTDIKKQNYGGTITWFPDGFADVEPGVYYEIPVRWAVENGITNGMDGTHFAPDNACTRAQIVTFLWRAAGSPEPRTPNNSFTDVTAGSFYYKAVLWAVENGITSGMDETHFAPDAPCTRGQVVTFLWRFRSRPASSGGNVFTDVTPGAYYYDAVLWAVEKGISNGMGDGTFGTDVVCSRGQIVTFLYRTLA